MQRKNLTAHNVIAEATKATGNVLAQHMQDITESSRELERSKIEVPLKLFSEQMEYQREKIGGFTRVLLLRIRMPVFQY